MDEKPRLLLLLDERWGANYLIDDGRPSIRTGLEAAGFALETAGPRRRLSPCRWASRNAGLGPIEVDRLVGELVDPAGYDGIVILPGQDYSGLLAEPSLPPFLRAADRTGLLVAAFCRGIRVLARAGLVAGRRVAGHADYRAEVEAAGGRFAVYADLGGKSDAPPPLVDGNLVTGLRSNHFRGAMVEAIRIAAGNARAARLAPPPEDQATAAPALSRAASPAASPAARPAAARLAFGLPLWPGAEREGLLLMESIRAFGGGLATAPILVAARDGGRGLAAGFLRALPALGAELVPYAADEEARALPFGEKPFAAAAVEARCRSPVGGGGAELLAWLDPDAFVVREPGEFLLPAGTDLAFRPVHHTLVGSRFEAPLDVYWTAIHEAVGGDPAAAFPMTATIDRAVLRPYFNAGCLALRPEIGLLAAWAAAFSRCLAQAKVTATLAADPRRGIFLHQAALTAAALARLPRAAMRELSFAYNYPLHLHGRCPPELRPRRLEDLFVLRYDEWGNWPGAEDWRAVLSADEPRAAWLDARRAALATLA
ncbi:MAG: DJ-1/PfpI family protein [Spirochaetaceae bacterium]|nr:DJ-1/PfpI family protein [Spirochaetaceae bacterium]